MKMGMKPDMLHQQFKNEYQKAHTNILFTASWLNLLATQALKRYNVSPQQFNVLRILQKAHPNAVTVKVLTEQMIDKMSNASRLVEKLKLKGLVEREADDDDRRRVNVSITEAGLALVEKATAAMEGQLEEEMKRISSEEISNLNQLLDQLRG